MNIDKDINQKGLNIIDIHSHILSGLDDGAKSIKESIEMARAAVQNGISIIVATPHRIKGSYYPSKSKINEKINELNNELKKEHLPVKIIFGAENYAEFDIDSSFTINNKKYFLLEFPINSYPEFCDKLTADLLKKKIIPIIANPEHNLGMMHNPKIVERLVNMGCLIQLSATSFTGHNAIKNFALFLLKNKMYHLFGSNAHNISGYESFSKALHMLHSNGGEEKALEMVRTIPFKIINGEEYIPEKINLKEKLNTGFGLRAFVSRITGKMFCF